MRDWSTKENHGAVDGDASAGSDKNGFADRQFAGGDRLDRAGASHGRLVRKEFEEVADRLAASTHRQVLQELHDQNKQSDDLRGEKLADRRRSDDRDRHRQLHGHAARENVLERLPENRLPADQKTGDPDHAYRREGLPHSEPHGCCGGGDQGDARRLDPIERVNGLVIVVSGFIATVIVRLAFSGRRYRVSLRNVGTRATTRSFLCCLGCHDADPAVTSGRRAGHR